MRRMLILITLITLSIATLACSNTDNEIDSNNETDNDSDTDSDSDIDSDTDTDTDSDSDVDTDSDSDSDTDTNSDTDTDSTTDTDTEVGELLTFEYQGPILAEGAPIDDMYYPHTLVTDWDWDGKKDLIIGGFLPEKVRFYKNIGTDSQPQFGSFVYLEAGGEVISLSGY